MPYTVLVRPGGAIVFDGDEDVVRERHDDLDYEEVGKLLEDLGAIGDVSVNGGVVVVEYGGYVADVRYYGQGGQMPPLPCF